MNKPDKDDTAQPGAVAVNRSLATTGSSSRRQTLASRRHVGSGLCDIQSKRDIFGGRNSSSRTSLTMSLSNHSSSSRATVSSHSLLPVAVVGNNNSSSSSQPAPTPPPSGPPSRRVSLGEDGNLQESQQLSTSVSTTSSSRDSEAKQSASSGRFLGSSRRLSLMDLESGQHEYAVMRFNEISSNDHNGIDQGGHGVETPITDDSIRTQKTSNNEGLVMHTKFSSSEEDKLSTPLKSDNEAHRSLWNSDSLVEARLVEETMEETDITEAAPIDPSDFAKPHGTTSNRKCVLLLRLFGAFLLVAGITVTVLATKGVFDGKSANDSGNIAGITNRGQNMNSTTTNTTEALLLELPDYTITAINENTDSPPFLAYQWLQNDPSFGNYTRERAIQRFALATLYYSTNGDDWFLNTSWLSYEDHECGWHSMLSGRDDDVCNEAGTYQVLSLTNNHLSGHIPPEISLLTSLEQLILANNLLQQTLPSELGLLTKLKQLDVQTNTLSGPLPSELGAMTNLGILWASKNSLSSTLPTTLGLLTSLQSLTIGINFFTGPIPTELGLLKQLQVLNMEVTELSGGIPSEIGQVTRLNALIQPSCYLTGTIPTELANIEKLEVLDLELNDLTGKIPVSLFQLTNLRELRLFSNELNGTFDIPVPSSDIMSLELLDLADNNLSGTIPLGIASLNKLEFLSMAKNPDLQGTIPTEIAALPKLSHLTIQDTGIYGTVPASLCSLDMLKMTCSDLLCGCQCDCGQEDNNKSLTAYSSVAANPDMPFA